MLVRRRQQEPAGILADEAGVGDLVALCVDAGIGDGLGIQFDPDDLLYLGSGTQPDRTDPTVSIQQPVAFFQCQQVVGFLGEPFALVVIDLIKRRG